MDTVDKLTEWKDKQEAGCQEVVKTVSRMVQSFEHVAINNLINETRNNGKKWAGYDFKNFLGKDAREDNSNNEHGGQEIGGASILGSISSVANALRRSDVIYHHFATLVVAEIILANFLSGQRNIQVSFFFHLPIFKFHILRFVFVCIKKVYLAKQLELKQEEAIIMMLRSLGRCEEAQIPQDTIGMPLMEMRGSMCISRGVLVVVPGSVSATYVLDIEPRKGDASNALDLSGVRNISITSVLDEEEMPGYRSIGPIDQISKNTHVPVVVVSPTSKRRDTRQARQMNGKP